MKTIVLGHSGFIGRAIHDGLVSRRAHVHGYSSASLDLRRVDAFRTLDSVVDDDTTLIFCSALTPDRGATLDRFVDNVAMVVNVARYLEHRSVGRCVYFSSDAVYAMGTNPVTEATPEEPLNLYALAKYVGERVLRTVAGRRNIPLLVLRPTGVYGPGDTHSSYGPNLFVRTIVAEKVVRLFGEGEELRDHLYVDDLVRMTCGLIEAGSTGVFNLATGRSRSFASIVADLRSVVPYAFTVVNMERKVAVTDRQFDVSRLLAALPELKFTEFRWGLGATFASAAAPSSS